MQAARALTVVITIGLIAGSTARAQVDFSVGRQTREVLHKLSPDEKRQTDAILMPLHLTARELHDELFRGDRADPAPLAAAAVVLRHFSEVAATNEDDSTITLPAGLLERLLEACAEYLTPLPRERWEEACRDILLAGVKSLEESRIEAAQYAATMLDQFSRRYPDVLDADNSWHQFLRWPLTERVISGDRLTADELNSLEVRWQNALLILHDFELREAALAVRTLIPLARVTQFPESQEEWERDWAELAELTRHVASGEPVETDHLMMITGRRERQGDRTRVIRSVRQTYSHPDVALELEWSGLKKFFPASLRQEFPVRGIFAGAPTSGTGEIVGEIDVQLLPAPLSAKWFLRFQGESLADTKAMQDRVQIDANSTTRIFSATQFTWNPRGVRASPAEWDASASVRFDRITAPGLPLRQRAAERRVRARRSWAESDTVASSREFVAQQVESLIQSWNDGLHHYYAVPVRERWLATNRLCPEVRIRSLQDRIAWTSQLDTADPVMTRVTPNRPASNFESDMKLAVSETAVERYLTGAFGGRTMQGESLRREFSSAHRANPQDLAENSAEEAWRELEVLFRDEAFRVTFRDGVVQFAFSCEQVRLGSTIYPPMQLIVSYRPEFSATSLALVRERGPEVRFLDKEGDSEPLSGRQQTLRLVAQRRLARLFPVEQEIEWRPFSLPDGRLVEIRPAGMQLHDGWWQAGLNWKLPN